MTKTTTCPHWCDGRHEDSPYGRYHDRQLPGGIEFMRRMPDDDPAVPTLIVVDEQWPKGAAGLRQLAARLLDAADLLDSGD